MKTKILFSFIPLLAFFACTSVEETTKEVEKKQPEVYVFDDVSKVDTSKAQLPKPEIKSAPKVEQVVPEQPTATTKKFTVQLGAFTSKDRAETFIKENQAKTSLPLTISFNGQTKLFAVQLPAYNTKQEADVIRDNLRKFDAFKEAFTAVVEK
jgi:cell division septation protein DedD